MKIFKNFKTYNYFPKTIEEFFEILKKKSRQKNNNLNDINVTFLDQLYGFSRFNFFFKNNFFVDELDVSNIKDFSYCFSNCFKFNCDLSLWDTSSAVKMNDMFDTCRTFNQKLNNFNFSNVSRIDGFLSSCKSFNQELYFIKFNRQIKDITAFLFDCFEFNQDISMWEMTNIENIFISFSNTKRLKQDLRNWRFVKLLWCERAFENSLMENYPELLPERLRKCLNKK